jgi:hypothetical protein
MSRNQRGEERMSNKQQTAVEWLIEQLRNNENIRWRGTNIIELGEQAKAMHKKEIEDAELRGKEIIIIKHTEHGGGKQ